MPISPRYYLFVISCPLWKMIIPGCSISLYFLDQSLTLFPPPSSLYIYIYIYIYMNPKNLALPFFLVYCQTSSRFCNVIIGKRDIFVVVDIERIKITIPFPVETVLPPLPPPSPHSEQWCLFAFFIGCTDQKKNIFWNYLKIKSPQQVNPRKVSWNRPNKPQDKNWISTPPINFNKETHYMYIKLLLKITHQF